MRIILLSLLLCANAFLLAAEEQPGSELKEDDKSKAADRADQLMQELKQSRVAVDEETASDFKKVDLLTRKAEAYILVEQPIDAGRMLDQVREILEEYKADKRSAVKDRIRSYNQRLLPVAKAVLEHSASINLDEDADQHADQTHASKTADGDADATDGKKSDTAAATADTDDKADSGKQVPDQDQSDNTRSDDN